MKGALIPYDRWVKRVVPSAFEENTCYVAYSGYRTHSEDKTYLFVTPPTWAGPGRTSPAGLMNPLFDLEEDPDNADVLYIAGDFGRLRQSGQGPDLGPLLSTLGPRRRRPRPGRPEARPADLVIGTYGRGIYIADIAPLKTVRPELVPEIRLPLRHRDRRPLEPARAPRETLGDKRPGS